jgi:hypothetical protein
MSDLVLGCARHRKRKALIGSFLSGLPLAVEPREFNELNRYEQLSRQ